MHILFTLHIYKLSAVYQFIVDPLDGDPCSHFFEPQVTSISSALFQTRKITTNNVFAQLQRPFDGFFAPETSWLPSDVQNPKGAEQTECTQISAEQITSKGTVIPKMIYYIQITSKKRSNG